MNFPVISLRFLLRLPMLCHSTASPSELVVQCTDLKTKAHISICIRDIRGSYCLHIPGWNTSTSSKWTQMRCHTMREKKREKWQKEPNRFVIKQNKESNIKKRNGTLNRNKHWSEWFSGFMQVLFALFDEIPTRDSHTNCNLYCGQPIELTSRVVRFESKRIWQLVWWMPGYSMKTRLQNGWKVVQRRNQCKA